MKRLTILSVFVLSIIIIPWQSRAQNAGPPGNGAVVTAPSQEAIPEDVVTLAKGLEQVMSASHNVLITQEGELMSSADVRIARSGFFPSINGSASHTSLEYQIAGVTQAGAIATHQSGSRRSRIYGALVTGPATESLSFPRPQPISGLSAPRSRRPSSISGGPSPSTRQARSSSTTASSIPGG